MHYRGEGFGFDELGTLDAFTALFAAEKVHFLKSDTFTASRRQSRAASSCRSSKMQKRRTECEKSPDEHGISAFERIVSLLRLPGGEKAILRLFIPGR